MTARAMLELTNSEIARRLGVSEGTVRYRRRRWETGAEDGREGKPSAVEAYDGLLQAWIDEVAQESRRPTLLRLHGMIREHGYPGSYDAVRRYVRKRYPDFHRKGACLRLETPPGGLLLVDWKEDLRVQLGASDAWRTVQALCLTLGFSRKTIVLFA